MNTLPITKIGAAVLLTLAALLSLATVVYAHHTTPGGSGSCFDSKGNWVCGSGWPSGPEIYLAFASITADPNPINQGDATTVSWTCTGSDPDVMSSHNNFNSSYAVSGSAVLYPETTTTYSVTCYTYQVSSTATVTVVVNALQPDVYTGATSPTTATAGTAVTLSATVSNEGTATASNFPNSFQISGVGYTAANALTVGAGSSGTMSASYTFSSAGDYLVRACADTDTGGNGSVTESDESDNCNSSWTTVTVSEALPPAPTNPQTSCNQAGTAVTLSWTAAPGATSYYPRTSGSPIQPQCGNFGWQVWVDGTTCYPNPDSGQAGVSVSSFPVTPGQQYSWWVHPANSAGVNWGVSTGSTFTCTSTLTQCEDGVDNDGDTLVDGADLGCGDDDDEGGDPTAELSANPTVVSVGESSTLEWDSENAGSCTGTGFNTGGATSGSVSTGVLNSPGDIQYQVNCGGDIDFATVSVTSPSVYITASEILVDGTAPGASIDLLWSASDVTTCSIESSHGESILTDVVPGVGTTTTAESGITKRTVYTLSCEPLDGGNSITSSVDVRITFDAGEF